MIALILQFKFAVKRYRAFPLRWHRERDLFGVSMLYCEKSSLAKPLIKAKTVDSNQLSTDNMQLFILSN